MNSRIIYTQEAGSIAVVIPTLEFIASNGDITVLAAKSVPKGVDYEVIPVDAIPTDRYFRNAWRWGNGIEIDRAHAEKIHLDNLRKVRDEKLKEMDIEYQKSLEFRDDVKMNAVAAKKKKLRDMPTDTDFTGMSLDEIKEFMPDVLKT